APIEGLDNQTQETAGKIMLKLTTTFLLLAGSLSLSCMTGCSLAARKSAEALPSPSPSSQRDADHHVASPGSAAPSTAESTEPEPSEPATASSEVSDQLHTPEKGSLERQGMMDALRDEFNDRRSPDYQPHRGSIIFVVNYLKAHNGWAWTYAEPHSSDTSDSFGENSGFLLHQEGGQWKVMRLPAMVNDPNDPENLDYPTRKDVERIRRMYPLIPTDIFPK
ncbi:MAG TPA: hypothetical protein VLQ90_03945, partial [Pyrinomonadaceae bacterium]|nr:hypothetical protein [Pyrinomonadaceae bacterium]